MNMMSDKEKQSDSAILVHIEEIRRQLNELERKIKGENGKVEDESKRGQKPVADS